MVGVAAQIWDCLNKRFVSAEDIARVLALAFLGKQNVILWGPGGHGKSMMVGEALKALGLESDSYFLSFGEGMDEATLWGGLDFRRLEQDKVLEYHPDRSFLAKKVAVFEELFDAPAQVLLSLKDTLTAKALRKGAQLYPMQTEVIIACTNRDPRKFGESDPAAAALVERFPLQYEVRWAEYNGNAYAEMYRKLGYKYDLLCRVLGEIMERLSEQGIEVSPRTAVHAMNAVFAAMKADGDEHPKPSHLTALRFVVGFENHERKITKEIERAMVEIQVKTVIEKADLMLEKFGEVAQLKLSSEQIIDAIREFGYLRDELEALQVPDRHVSTINNLKGAVVVAIQRATELQR